MTYNQNRQASDDINAGESPNARASPAVCDALRSRPTSVKNKRGLPDQERFRLKKIVQTRTGTLNVGSMTGRGREIVDMMQRRRIEILCVQETRWKGNKTRELGEGYKLFYSGVNAAGRNGVGIILNDALKTTVVNVNRRNDRIMSIKLDSEEILNIVSVYAPQVGCSDEEKDTFWNELKEEIENIPREERVIIGGDLNGHVGNKENETRGRVHGGWSVGVENEEGRRIVDFALASDMTLCNTYFKKPESQLITYKSGGNASQIDFLMYRRALIKEVKDCKVVNNESVTSQHRVVVMDCAINIMGKRKNTRVCKPKIKWWMLKDEEKREIFKRKVIENTRPTEGVKEWWSVNGKAIKEAAENVLGRTSGKGPPNEKESWWWNEEVQKAIKEKKDAWKKYGRTQSQEDKQEYNRAKKEAKRMVARAKAEALKEAMEIEDNVNGKRKLMRIAKQRDRASKDFTHVRQIKSDQGSVLRKDEDIKLRWRDYFEKLLNEENERSMFEDGVANLGMVEVISREEVARALKKMKSGKAAGPDEIPAEAWKSLDEYGVDMLWDLMNQVLEEECMPDEWRDSEIVPIYKEKGDIQDCKNYRGIKLISHTMKIWERIVDTRIRRETTIGEEQFGFMPGRGTMDAVFALRQLMEKYREKKKDLHLIFIDLEKAYDRIPRQEVWRCMRKKSVPEKYVRVIQDMYENARTKVRSCVGTSGSLEVRVGLHQGSVLSPYLFDLVIDCITEDIREEAPWTMMFADDVVLCDPSRESIERKVNLWKSKLEERGLRINVSKTVHLHLTDKGGEQEREESDEEAVDDMEEEERVKLGDVYLEKVNKFKYLGSSVCMNGELDGEIANRINAGWMNWRKMSGVLCEKRISAKNKGFIYKTVVRPAMLYGAETWQIKRDQEKRMNVAEMRMLRWMCGVTRMDRIRNTKIRGDVKVTELSKKVQERRLQWFGHVERRSEEYVGKRVKSMEVVGKRVRGRPRTRYMDRVRADLRERGMDEALAQDRDSWRQMSKNVDPT